MIHRIELGLSSAEGALLRMLGTVERRGFRITGCEVRQHGTGLAVKLELDGERDPELLCRQLQRLLDVGGVSVLGFDRTLSGEGAEVVALL
jgi:acetolactate synthase II small subunit